MLNIVIPRINFIWESTPVMVLSPPEVYFQHVKKPRGVNFVFNDPTLQKIICSTNLFWMFFRFTRTTAQTWKKFLEIWPLSPLIEQFCAWNRSKISITLQFLLETNYLRKAANFVPYFMKKLGKNILKWKIVEEVYIQQISPLPAPGGEVILQNIHPWKKPSIKSNLTIYNK